MFIYGGGEAAATGVPGRGEDKIWGAGGSPPVASTPEVFGEAKSGRAAGSPSVAAGSFGVADEDEGAVGGAAGPGSSGVCGRASAHPSRSQNFASEVPTTLAGLRLGTKARHSAWQVGLMSLPFHMAAMRVHSRSSSRGTGRRWPSTGGGTRRGDGGGRGRRLIWRMGNFDPAPRWRSRSCF